MNHKNLETMLQKDSKADKMKAKTNRRRHEDYKSKYDLFFTCAFKKGDFPNDAK